MNRLKGSRIYLRALTEHDATDTYCSWLKDKDITQYLETRFQEHTIENIRQFIEEKNKSSNEFFFGIFMLGDDA
ncbi:MAG: hypothetical protein KAR20_18280, partial [Candidatus Heimdallarchaeota archaeon]|nr:hypothetical protein [Candidatus Heimdallarchaeota archaeon]